MQKSYEWSRQIDFSGAGDVDLCVGGCALNLASFQAMWDAVPVGLCVIDPGLRFISLNRRLTEMTGRTADDSIGHTLAEVTPGVAGHLIPAVQKALRGEAVCDLEFEGTQSGLICEGRVFLASMQPLPAHYGGVAAVLCSVLDITERKRADQAWRTREVQFRIGFDQAAIGIAHIGFDGRWLWVNMPLCNMLGYTRDELMAVTYAAVTPSDEVAAARERTRRLYRGELSSYSLERRLVRKDGELLFAQLTVSLLRDENGAAQNIVAFIEDISVRKSAEVAVIKSESLLSRAMSVARMAAWEWDPANDEIYASTDLGFPQFRRRGKECGRLVLARQREFRRFRRIAARWKNLAGTKARVAQRKSRR